MPEKEIIIEIAIERLRDFPGSPFKVTMDEPMSDLIESIQTYGILIPLIIRPIPEGCYQIISGHRRRFAAAKLGYRKVPVIIRAMNDDEALVAMVDSNLQREKIRISEKAFAYRMKYDVAKREGKHPKEYFYGEKYRGMKTIEFMGKEQKDSPKQVQRIEDQDIRMKPYFYPSLEKQELFAKGYIASQSSHSRGSTVDLTLLDMSTGKELDMGSPFDLFSEISHPDCQAITREQYENRMLLQHVMIRNGFVPIDCEWWHFSLKNEPYPDTYFSFPVSSAYLRR